MFRTSGEILDHFRSRDVTEDSLRYLQTHAKRYAFLLGKVEKVAPMLRTRQSLTILDIGPSFLTELLLLTYPNDLIFTVGFDSADCRGGHFPLCIAYERSRHSHFDLNDVQYPEKWISLPQADLVIMAEVLEHLYTAPILVLKFLHTIVRKGGFVMIETPNAASLKKRMKLMAGRHPYEMIRVDARNPGHFREYTRSELVAIARASGFEVRGCDLSNYFSHDSSKGVFQRFLRGIGPPSLRRGMTLVLEKPA